MHVYLDNHTYIELDCHSGSTGHTDTDAYGEPVPPTVTGAFMIPWEKPISTLVRLEVLADNIDVNEYTGTGRIVDAAFFK